MTTLFTAQHLLTLLETVPQVHSGENPSLILCVLSVVLNLPLALELRYRLRPGHSDWFKHGHETFKAKDTHEMCADSIQADTRYFLLGCYQ